MTKPVFEHCEEDIKILLDRIQTNIAEPYELDGIYDIIKSGVYPDEQKTKMMDMIEGFANFMTENHTEEEIEAAKAEVLAFSDEMHKSVVEPIKESCEEDILLFLDQPVPYSDASALVDLMTMIDSAKYSESEKSMLKDLIQAYVVKKNELLTCEPESHECDILADQIEKMREEIANYSTQLGSEQIPVHESLVTNGIVVKSGTSMAKVEIWQDQITFIINPLKIDLGYKVGDKVSVADFTAKCKEAGLTCLVNNVNESSQSFQFFSGFSKESASNLCNHLNSTNPNPMISYSRKLNPANGLWNVFKNNNIINEATQYHKFNIIASMNPEKAEAIKKNITDIIDKLKEKELIDEVQVTETDSTLDITLLTAKTTVTVESLQSSFNNISNDMTLNVYGQEPKDGINEGNENGENDDAVKLELFDGTEEPIKDVSELKVGETYKTPAPNKKGAYRIEYKGVVDGKHEFQNLHEGLENSVYSLSDEGVSEDIFPATVSNNGETGDQGNVVLECKVGDKIRIKVGDFAGQEGMVESVADSDFGIKLETGEIIHLSLDDIESIEKTNEEDENLDQGRENNVNKRVSSYRAKNQQSTNEGADESTAIQITISEILNTPEISDGEKIDKIIESFGDSDKLPEYSAAIKAIIDADPNITDEEVIKNIADFISQPIKEQTNTASKYRASKVNESAKYKDYDSIMKAPVKGNFDKDKDLLDSIIVYIKSSSSDDKDDEMKVKAIQKYDEATGYDEGDYTGKPKDIIKSFLEDCEANEGKNSSSKVFESILKSKRLPMIGEFSKLMKGQKVNEEMKAGDHVKKGEKSGAIIGIFGDKARVLFDNEKSSESVALSELTLDKTYAESILEAKNGTYTIIKNHKGKDKPVTGTIAELEQYFSYTLLLAYEANKIKKKEGFTTINQLMTALDKAYDFTQGSKYDRDYVTLDKSSIDESKWVKIDESVDIAAGDVVKFGESEAKVIGIFRGEATILVNGDKKGQSVPVSDLTFKKTYAESVLT